MKTTQKDKISLVEKYIKDKKGKKVVIDMNKPHINLDKAWRGEHPFEAIPTDEHNKMLDIAYKYAKEFYDEIKKANTDRQDKQV